MASPGQDFPGFGIMAWREAHELGLVEPVEESHRGHREHGARIRRAGERFVLVLSKASAREAAGPEAAGPEAAGPCRPAASGASLVPVR